MTKLAENNSQGTTNIADDRVLAAVNYLYLMAGISEPTDQDNNLVMEAIVYANIDYWVDNPMTHSEYSNRKMFEIKSISYFMRKLNYNDMEAVRYFKEYEHWELTNLRAVTLNIWKRVGLPVNWETARLIRLPITYRK